ncbi:MAG: hypothetical protein ACYDAG_01190, partial [Chloroflexota bacterium]
MHQSQGSEVSRRTFLSVIAVGAGATLLAACGGAVTAPSGAAPASSGAASAKPAAQSASAGAASSGAAPAKVTSLTAVLHQSPWLPGYKVMAQAYTKKTGVQINISTFPFNNLFEKERTAVVNKTNEFDMLSLGESWVAFFAGGGFLVPLKKLDPGFTFDAEVTEYAYLDRWDPKTK